METDIGKRIENLLKYRDKYIEMKQEESIRLSGLLEDGTSGIYSIDQPSNYIDLKLGKVLSIDERIDKSLYISGRISVLDEWIARIEKTIVVLRQFLASTHESLTAQEPESSYGSAKLDRLGPAQVLFVEGELDIGYFELLRDPSHGEHQLCLNGKIISYGGCDGLGHIALIKAIVDIAPRVYFTFDLDATRKIKPELEKLQLKQGTDFCEIGLPEKGKECIEGLVPDSIYREVLANNVEIARRLFADSNERNSARNQLKRLLFEAFKEKAKPGKEHFGLFYDLADKINRALHGN